MSDSAGSHDAADLHHVDDVKVGNIVYYGFLSVAITVLVVMLLHALYVWSTAAQVRKKSLEYDPEHTLAATLNAQQESQLEAAPHWYDEEKTMVAIPLERAMELTIAEYGGTVNAASEGESEVPAAGKEAFDTPAEPEVEGEGTHDATTTE